VNLILLKLKNKFMEQNIIFLIVGVVALVLGVVVGYYVRQSIAKKRAGTLEARLEKRVADVKESTALMIKKAEQKAFEINEKSEKEVDQRRKEFLRSQELLLSREKLLEDKISNFESKENELKDKVEKVRAIKDSLDTLRKEAETKLEKVANLSRDDAK